MMKQFGKTKWTGLLRCALLTLLLVMMMAQRRWGPGELSWSTM